MQPKAAWNELNHRLAYLITILLLPVIIPVYILAQALLAALTEVPRASSTILPVLKDVPKSLRIVFNPRRTL